MPRPVEILSSIVIITFIGRTKLPLRRIHSLFQVHRRVVKEALIWLKGHNQKYYGNIEIDSNQLRLLLEDGVPLEIASTMRHSTDEGLIEEESLPYVPSHCDDNEDQGNDIVLKQGGWHQLINSFDWISRWIRWRSLWAIQVMWSRMKVVNNLAVQHNNFLQR